MNFHEKKVIKGQKSCKLLQPKVQISKHRSSIVGNNISWSVAAIIVEIKKKKRINQVLKFQKCKKYKKKTT